MNDTPTAAALENLTGVKHPRSWDLDKWHKYFVLEAEVIAVEKSKDPSTQVGACLVRPDKTIAAKGYNGFPRAIKDDPELLANRDTKYPRIIHAEMNALITCREDMTGFALYTYPFIPCDRCAVIFIQAGIVFVAAPNPTPEAVERWGDKFQLSRDLFFEAGVHVLEFDYIRRMK